MTAVILELPDKLLSTLKKRAESEGKALEELISVVIFNHCDIKDPEVKAEVHLKLCEKYLREGEELLTKKDFTQASEKFWGSASQIVKALAAKRGLELRSHGELHREVAKIAEEIKDVEIRPLWQSAISLHQNFYENWLPPEMVKGNINDVKKLVEKLKQLLR